MMSVERISRRLDDRFRLLTGGARTALPRQQTLRALIDLELRPSCGERAVAPALALRLRGRLDSRSFTEEVCSGDGLAPDDVLDLLTQLVNKSLVVVMEASPSGETRYRMRETIRQYARETAGNGWRRTRAGSASGPFCEASGTGRTRPCRSNQVFWSNRLEEEIDNLRIALEWALATDVEAGIQIAALPWRWWDTHGYFREMGEWLAQTFERYPTTDSLHAQALAVCSWYLFRQGIFVETVQLAEHSLQMARALPMKKLRHSF